VIVVCENVYKTFTHKSNKPDSSHWLTPYDNHLLCTLSPTNLLPTVGYFRFLYVPSSSVKTPLSSQVGNLVFIPAFNVLSSVLSIVLFLRASCCFPAVVKTHSIPPPDPGQPSYGPFYHIRSNERSNELLLSHNRWFQGEKYRSPPCQTTECVRLTAYGLDRSILLKGILKSIL
jgi:hypothetical protein